MYHELYNEVKHREETRKTCEAYDTRRMMMITRQHWFWKHFVSINTRRNGKQ